MNNTWFGLHKLLHIILYLIPFITLMWFIWSSLLFKTSNNLCGCPSAILGLPHTLCRSSVASFVLLHCYCVQTALLYWRAMILYFLIEVRDHLLDGLPGFSSGGDSSDHVYNTLQWFVPWFSVCNVSSPRLPMEHFITWKTLVLKDTLLCVV